MHLSNNEAYTFASKITSLLASVSCFLPEMNIGTINQDRFLQAVTLPSSLRWAAYIKQSRYEKYAAILEKAFGIPIHSLDNLHPFYAMQLLSYRLHEHAHPENLDKFLWLAAMSQNKQIIGLETFDEQMEVLSKISYKTGFDALHHSFTNIPKFHKNLKSLSALYAEGDITKIYKKSYRSLGSLRSTLLHSRNENMSLKLISQIKAGPASLCAVGAAHLGGNTGLVAILKREGYSLKCLI
jgi:hypothetical protein